MNQAASTNDRIAITTLIAARADINGVELWGNTALHCAARVGSVECVKVLLNAKAHVDVTNDSGDTPLHEASEHGCSACVRVGE
jgi:uncharacterized protein